MLFLLPLTWILLVRKLGCTSLKTTKQKSRWSKRKEALQWDMFPEPTELLLVGCLIESIWTPRSKSKYIDNKNQIADILTKGNFTREEWNHLLCLFNISHFSSICNPKAMSKRTQEDANEKIVAAKSKPKMNWVSRCRVRDPNVLASTALESPRKPRMYLWAR